MKPVPIILGATAVGKTAVALTTAPRLNAEIIGADSRQVYRGFDIGTAKPGPEARRQVVHHLIDFLGPEETYSAGDFARDAGRLIGEITARGKRPLVVGGSGLYVRALVEGLTPGLGRDPVIRSRLERLSERIGSSGLHQALSRLDPEAAGRIKPGDRHRLSRAMELFLIHRKTLKEVHGAAKSRKLAAVIVGIRLPREVLYRRIEERVDRMMESGLVDEVRGLLAAGTDAGCNAMTGLGYRECVAHLRGEIDLPTTVNLIKRNSRRYAKRQATFFRTIAGIHWLDVRGSETPRTVAEMVLERIGMA